MSKMRNGMTGIINLNKKNDWETPPDLFKLGCDYFAFEPQLDVCATARKFIMQISL